MSNELTDVRCPCGAEFQADSYDAGFIAGSGMCQNCDAALPPKDICTCPSGDGSLRHPCPAHPAPVEHAGGDERDVQGAQGERQAFEAHESRERRLSPADQKFWFRRGAVADYDIKSIDDAWKAWKARAALAQPALQCKKCGGTGDADSGGIHPWGETAMVPCDCAHTERAQGKRTEDGDTIIDRLRLGGLTIDGDNAYKRDLLDCVVGALAFGFQGRPAPEETHWLHRFWEIGNAEREARAALAQPSPVPAEKAEAERPEVVAVMESNGAGGKRLAQRFPIVNVFVGDELMTVAQHERIVKAWIERWKAYIELSAKIAAQRDAANARLHEVATACATAEQERDAALARVAELESKLAELEMQAPVAFLYRGTDMGDQFTIIRLDHYWRPKYSTEEHDYIKGIPLYAAPVAQAQHSVPETINEEANSFLRIADAGQFKDNAVAVRTAAVIIRGLLHRPALMQSIIRHRIGLTPEYEGQWHADLYGEDGEVQHHAEADTPDEAVRAVVALAAAPGKEG
ncbi:hypothetical protein [Pseudomonas aeruginosa]|uniref:hypothetical protein n=1 Tax=Pseudomonas aeruginosa TaxID=287 RepID=UPI001CDC54CE|nr:hypothetical protein [Pseudomonas aeruginosa]MCA4038771.1 hypothetical protein [Pseudomonas aeruginosa]